MFENDKLYAAADPELTAIIPYSTSASWRHEGKGPSYLKVGSRVSEPVNDFETPTVSIY